MPRIVASQTLATGRACAPSACLQWSDDGQVVVATKEALHILTPRVGAALEHEVLGAPPESECAGAYAPDPVHEDPTASVVPSMVLGGPAWYAAAWSPSSAARSCLLATIDTRRSVRLYAGPTCLGDVDMPRLRDDDDMARQCTCLAWQPHAAEPAWLLIGTRSGHVVLFRVQDTWEYVAHSVVPGCVRAISWGTHVMVHAGEHLVQLHMPRMSVVATRRVGAAHISGLVQLRSRWLWATPHTCWAWDADGQVRSADTRASHAAGHDATRLILSDGTAWDGDSLEPCAPPRLWGYATDASGWCAMLQEADEDAPWRYVITHKLAFTLHMPPTPPPVPTDGAPASVWRAWALWRQERGQEACEALWTELHARVTELDARVDALLTTRPAAAAWLEELRHAHRWAWWIHLTSADEAAAHGLQGLPWTVTWLGGVCRAAALLESDAKDEAYARRVAAALFCMAQQAGSSSITS
ncbi:hypothetical protein DNF11_1409 [Malassezia restricta CBS 7877]|uniref:Uncharacterized protein n=1 Tax=Malassezia restricta (strain ATCC 96810 / NBRC 103918 / CBS 7877) TaxID=425264 RepID=A0A3G2S4R3_MALR7|nr:hypothetical protein DNF11_1409 [Malassezia restricta CBS 7877]